MGAWGVESVQRMVGVAGVDTTSAAWLSTGMLRPDSQWSPRSPLVRAPPVCRLLVSWLSSHSLRNPGYIGETLRHSIVSPGRGSRRRRML